MNYNEANETLNHPRKKDSKKLANNTYLTRLNDSEIALKLHETNVITYQKSGAIILNSGGWRSVTTKERINHFQNLVRLYQENSVWYVHSGTYSNPIEKPDTKIFKDGIKITKSGRIYNGLPVSEVKKVEKLKGKILCTFIACKCNRYLPGL